MGDLKNLPCIIQPTSNPSILIEAIAKYLCEPDHPDKCWYGWIRIDDESAQLLSQFATLEVRLGDGRCGIACIEWVRYLTEGESEMLCFGVTELT